MCNPNAHRLAGAGVCPSHRWRSERAKRAECDYNESVQKKPLFPLIGAFLLAAGILLVACRPGGTPPAVTPAGTPTPELIQTTVTSAAEGEPAASLTPPIQDTPGEQEGADRGQMPGRPTPTLSPPIVFRLQAEPFRTPVPTQPAASSPAGAITYLMRSSDGAVAVQRLAVGDDGAASAPPDPVKTLQEPPDGFSYSPDGRWVARVLDQGRLAFLDLETGEERLLPLPAGADAFLGWHPGGQHILVRSQASLSLVNLHTGEEARLILVPRTEGLVSAAAFSPDGQRMIFAVERPSSNWREIWTASVDSSEKRLLRKIEHPVEGFVWSPDSSQVAFSGDGLMVMGAGGEILRTVDRTGAGFWTWSPDGRTLAVVTDYGGNAGSAVLDGTLPLEIRIYLIDVETGWERLLLPHFEPGNLDPAWSPDGSQIAFVAARGDTTQLWIADADGGNLRTVTEDHQGVRFPAWFAASP